MSTAETIQDADWANPPLVVPPRMTEDEFETWVMSQEDVRAEWVDGEVVMMSPVNREHSRLNSWLGRVIGMFAEFHDLGDVLGPETMVRFGRRRRRRVPDLLFLAKQHEDRLLRNHLDGPPDLVIEIVSPSSVARDWRDKYLDYEKAGVPEYWVIDPDNRLVEVYSLGADNEYTRVSEQDGKLYSHVLPNFFLRVEWLWPASRPKVAAALRELGVTV